MTKISRTLNNIMLGIKRDDILKTKDLKRNALCQSFSI